MRKLTSIILISIATVMILLTIGINFGYKTKLKSVPTAKELQNTKPNSSVNMEFLLDHISLILNYRAEVHSCREIFEKDDLAIYGDVAPEYLDLQKVADAFKDSGIKVTIRENEILFDWCKGKENE
jgi:hypothetical protein